jgi:hypothetical protein
MAKEYGLKIASFIAGADLSSYQFRFVKMSGVDTVVLAEDSTVPVVGVLLNNPTSGQSASVAYEGFCKVKASAGITQGALVAPTTGGKAVTTATTGHITAGLCVDTCSTDDLADIFLMRYQQYVS